MAEFEIEVEKIAGWADEIDGYSEELKTQEGRVGSVSRQLMFRGDYQDVERALSKIADSISKQRTQMKQYGGMLGNIVKEYKSTESAIAAGRTIAAKIQQASDWNFDLDLLPSPLIKSDIPGGLVSIINGVKPSDTKSKNIIIDKINDALEGVKNDEDEYEIIKKLLKGADSIGGVGEAGILNDFIDYMQNFADFFTGDKKGLTGAADWCNLTDSSISVWESIYQYSADFYDVKTGFFGEAVQKKVAALGLTGGLFELAGSMFTTAKEKGTFADYFFDVANASPDLWKSSYTIKHIGDADSLLKKKAGIWNVIDVYAAVAKAGIGTLSQGYDSYKKYSANGKWDRQDTANTAIDASIAGIYGLGHALSLGLDDFILGGIDKATGGNGTKDKSYFEKAAEGYKMLGDTIGTKLGKWWNDLTK